MESTNLKVYFWGVGERVSIEDDSHGEIKNFVFLGIHDGLYFVLRVA